MGSSLTSEDTDEEFSERGREIPPIVPPLESEEDLASSQSTWIDALEVNGINMRDVNRTANTGLMVSCGRL